MAAHRKVAGDLGVPDAVKFDAQGFIVSTQVASGQVLRIDPRTGERTVLADLAPGLDNLTFVGERLFVSSISGQINEILAAGKLRSLVPDGLNWPLGLAMGEDGVLFVADGPLYLYAAARAGAAGWRACCSRPAVRDTSAAWLPAGPGELIVTTANGAVARCRPAQQESEVLAERFDRLYGVAIAPGGARGIRRGSVRGAYCRSARARSRCWPLACANPWAWRSVPDGTCFVAECGAGRVVRLARGGVETVLDGLQQPQGILVRGDLLYVVDALARELIEYDMASKARRTIASDLPVGAPAGSNPQIPARHRRLVRARWGPSRVLPPVRTARSTFPPMRKAASWRCDRQHDVA